MVSKSQQLETSIESYKLEVRRLRTAEDEVKISIALSNPQLKQWAIDNVKLMLE